MLKITAGFWLFSQKYPDLRFFIAMTC